MRTFQNKTLGIQAHLNPGLQLITVQGPEALELRHYDIGDKACPAFIRKFLGIPRAMNILDPETPAIERKKLGVKLHPYHMDIWDNGYLGQ